MQAAVLGSSCPTGRFCATKVKSVATNSKSCRLVRGQVVRLRTELGFGSHFATLFVTVAGTVLVQNAMFAEQLLAPVDWHFRRHTPYVASG